MGVKIGIWNIVLVFWGERGARGATASTYSNEAALSLRSRRSGTKFANPASCGFAH